MGLETLGLSDLEEACYRALLPRPGSDVRRLARDLEKGETQIRAALRRLEQRGLVSRTPGRRPAYVPSPPNLAVEALVQAHQAELERARAEVASLTELYGQGLTPHQTRPPVDLVTGREAISQRWVQVQRSAREEVRLFDKPPYVNPPTQPNPVEQELLATGIRYRVLYEAASFDVPGKLESARASVAAGEDARVAPRLPTKLIIADHDTALTHNVEGVLIQDAIIVHPHALLDALIAMFDMIWQQAVPLRFDGVEGEDGDVLDSSNWQILSLLAVGATDKAIARRLGVGLRTVRRRVAKLTSVLGTRTRFQTAVEAVRRGWL